MKKIVLLCAVFMIGSALQAQKSKKSINTKETAGKSVVGKVDNLTAELLKRKNDYQLYVLVAEKGKKDTLALKTITEAKDASNLPKSCTITPFTAKGVKLYQFSWIEKSTTEIPDKKEIATRTVSEIWNVQTRSQLYSNMQTRTQITQILYLDKLKNASQTSEKIRNEGFDLTLSPEGDLILKNKTQENRMSYDVAQNSFVAVKGNSQSGSAASKKRK